MQKLKSCDYVFYRKRFMTDSTINTNSGDGGLEVGASTDELFGEIDDESLEGDAAAVGAGDEETAESTDSTAAVRDPTGHDTTRSGGSTASDGVEDQTAAAVFGQLQRSVSGSDTDDVDDVLADETPADIIASADEPEPEPADDDLLVDEAALEELLLTDRTKDQEFLWVETDAADAADDAAADDATDAADDTTETPVETEHASETADDLDSGEAALDDADTEIDGEATGDADGTSDHVPFQETTEESASSEDDQSESASNPDADAETPQSTETALVTAEDADVPATTDGDDGSSGLLGWLRSKVGGLF